MSTQHLSLLAVVFFVSGIIGGIAGKIISKYTKDKNKNTLFESILIGIVAAFIIPLLLNMISSDLLTQSEKNNDKLLVVASISLLAATFSRKFLYNMYDNFMNRLNDMDARMEDVEEKTDESQIADSEVREESFDKYGLSKLEYDIIQSIGNSNYSYRSLTGISRSINVDKEEINKSISSLVSKGYLDQTINSNHQIRWFLTNSGRNINSKLNELK